ncbi:MAG TPA: Ig-like domain-containing protein [Gemmatimonadales bacterium]|nr:Ig-like domain-containing protein [Gemmatimonadales bacterium]
MSRRAPGRAAEVLASVALVAVALAAAGCGGSDGGGPTAPDTQAPTVVLEVPAAETLGGVVVLRAQADDDRGVAGVALRLDGAPLGEEDTTAPYEWSWNTGEVGDGPHTLAAVARDAAGNVTATTPVSVVVRNVAPPATGGMTITVTTTGMSLDPDGYTVAVDGGAAQSLAVAGTLHLADLAAGDHLVALDGVAANCQVSGENPRTVAVAAGATAAADFALTCAPLGGGRGELAFASLGYNGTLKKVVGALRLVDVDGNLLTSLTDATAYNGYPSWSPDGSRLAFQTDRDGNSEIYVMNADGSGLVRLTDDPAMDQHPAWSPDGSRIAFTTDRDGSWEIYVMNADGSGVVRLTRNTSIDAQPAWSPDGSRIAFQSQRDGNSEIYVMDADGANPVRLTNDPAYDLGPAWSPDGSRIAFQRGGNPYVMNADGSGAAQIAFGGGGPAWSPDGSRLADMPASLRLMQPDGSGEVRLPAATSAYQTPVAWRP